jgi:hypothetical protein
MYDMNELLKRMEAGESADDIAAAFSKALTDANKAHQENIHKQKVAEITNAKMEEMACAVRHILDVIAGFWPDLTRDATSDMTAEDKETIFNALVEAIVVALDKTERDIPVLANIMGVSPTSLMKETMLPNAPVFKKPAKSDDDILNSFLNSICH